METEYSKKVEMAYCQICNLPPEYCEFGKTLSECKKSLQEALPSIFEKLYIGQDKEEEDGKQEQKKKKEKQQVKKQVKIQMIERTKRKRTTLIVGLDLFGIDLKKASKLFASKFACGCSVTKGTNGDEITIQGDFCDQVLELIEQNYPEVGQDISIIEPKKK